MTSHLVGFIGGPCTGKTTIASYLYDAINYFGVSCKWIGEFVSEDLKKNGNPDPEILPMEQLRYTMVQSLREKEAIGNFDVILSDAPLLIGYAYALQTRVNSMENLHPRSELFMEALESYLKSEAWDRYNRLYFLKREITYELNGVRFHSEQEACKIDEIIINLLKNLGVKFQYLSGTVEERAVQVMEDLQEDGIALPTLLPDKRFILPEIMKKTA